MKEHKMSRRNFLKVGAVASAAGLMTAAPVAANAAAPAASTAADEENCFGLFQKKPKYIFLCFLSFCNQSLKTFCNLVFTVCSKLFIDVTQIYFITFCLRKCLRNSGTHCSSSNNTNFHCIYLHCI